MSAALELSRDLGRNAGKPAYVMFHAEAKHLPKQSEDAGRYIAVDVDMVTVRQLGSADSSIFDVKRWLKQNILDVQAGRLPQEHADYYEKAYRHWKLGQELPLEGTPIKGWAVISPAQQETIIKIGIRTVEEMSSATDEALQRIGIGAVMTKHKAQAWLAQALDKGPLTQENAALKQQNELLLASLETLKAQNEMLTKMAQQAPKTELVSVPCAASPADTLAAEILAEEAPAQKRKR